MGAVNYPNAVLKTISTWTSGQPFLTQKLCQCVVQSSQSAVQETLTLPLSTEAFWIEQTGAIAGDRQRQAQDNPEHLRTIRDRLLQDQTQAGRLLGLYQQILRQDKTAKSQPSFLAHNPSEEIELLLSGLVELSQGSLRVKNRIYEADLRQQMKRVIKELTEILHLN